MPPMTFVPTFPFTERHDVYPEIDPEPQFAAKTHKGKVVLITGSSRGIGEDLAIFYAKAGASLILAARTQKALDSVKAEILRQMPSAEVLTVPTDVVDLAQVEAAVKAGIERFGKLDIVIANAGKADQFNQSMTDKDPVDWWNILEVNVRGVYNVAHFTLPYLSKVDGYFLVTASVGGFIRMLNGSAYNVSKAAVNAFVEFVALEFPNVKVFAMHPGVIETEMTQKTTFVPEDSVHLASATYLYLTAGKADWLSGRFVSATWDLGELQRDWKDKILESNAFVSRAVIPV
ncbi:NAD-P-binding protein [Dentipellis sp. KUC8613]|nr:NAD-P-binding protein [Dentipellis sp. KUC8613]